MLKLKSNKCKCNLKKIIESIQVYNIVYNDTDTIVTI